MLNFFKSVLLATLTTAPIFVGLFTFGELRPMGGMPAASYEVGSPTIVMLASVFGIIGAGYILPFVCLSALLIDRVILPNGGTNMQYAKVGALVGAIGSVVFGIFPVLIGPALAGFAGGWVYGANRKFS